MQRNRWDGGSGVGGGSIRWICTLETQHTDGVVGWVGGVVTSVALPHLVDATQQHMGWELGG